MNSQFFFSFYFLCKNIFLAVELFGVLAICRGGW